MADARNFLLENPAIAAEIEKKILAKLGIGAKPEAVPAPVEAPAAKATEKPAARAAKPVEAAADDAPSLRPAANA